MLSVKKMAEKYYPAYWNKDRLRSLVQAGKLTEEEYQEITGEKY